MKRSFPPPIACTLENQQLFLPPRECVPATSPIFHCPDNGVLSRPNRQLGAFDRVKPICPWRVSGDQCLLWSGATCCSGGMGHRKMFWEGDDSSFIPLRLHSSESV
ncbi:hypothetical protein TNIN_297751 [Trichonephila inaurata madagascariensis]|uniref:Uncharacterized protein n=1 Tax=Trichonephila inaurata madagascariensis TaxID=2747483 RepID=A0A8X6XT68_9ARAC|nr:hypothetical protein TNIN_297751 [Trichonephila inaurata madagascariensis]